MNHKKAIKAKIDEQQALYDLAEKENRAMTSVETEKFNALQADIDNMIKTAEAREALKLNLQNATAVPQPNAAPTDDESIFSGEAYKNAWLNMTRGCKLNVFEQETLAKAAVVAAKSNAVSENTPYFIPTTIADEIFSLMAEQHPIINDVRVMHVKGNFTLNIHTGITNGDADVIQVGDCLEPEENTFVSVTLGGYQYGKLVEIPYAMRVMAITAYEAYLRSELAARLGSVIARDMFYGPAPTAGTSATRITGIIPFMTAKAPKRVIPYDKLVTYTDLTEIMAATGKVDGDRFIYVNDTTYWKQLANIVDGLGRPLFINDPATGNIRSFFGVQVKIESAVKDGEVIVGKPYNGYLLNWNQDITVGAQDNLRGLRTDVVGWCLVDGAPTTEYAWAELKQSTAGDINEDDE